MLVTELHPQPQMFYSAEVKICPLKTLKQHQCGEVVSSKGLDFGGELQQPEKWKSLKEQEKKQGSSIIFESSINIPKSLVLNSYQTPSKYVTVGRTTMAPKNSTLCWFGWQYRQA